MVWLFSPLEEIQHLLDNIKPNYIYIFIVFVVLFVCLFVLFFLYFLCMVVCCSNARNSLKHALYACQSVDTGIFVFSQGLGQVQTEGDGANVPLPDVEFFLYCLLSVLFSLLYVFVNLSWGAQSVSRQSEAAGNERASQNFENTF